MTGQRLAIITSTRAHNHGGHITEKREWRRQPSYHRHPKQPRSFLLREWNRENKRKVCRSKPYQPVLMILHAGFPQLVTTRGNATTRSPRALPCQSTVTRWHNYKFTRTVSYAIILSQNYRVTPLLSCTQGAWADR